jgi:PKD repeat protein
VDIGQSVNFTANASGTAPLTETWDFGDGSASLTGSPVMHSYAGANTYTVTLTVTDANQLSTKTTTQIKVFSPPVANAGGPYAGDAGTTLSFTGSATGGAPGSTTYSWDFGDGSSGTGASTSHTYNSAGNYTATLKVSDSAGGTNSQTAAVTIVNPPAVSSGGPYQGIPNTAINFTGNATGGTGTDTFTWNWGDGTSSNGNPASHTYSSGGTYQASLTVTDAAGGSNTASFNVLVKTDTTPPVVSIVSPAALALFNSKSNGVVTVNVLAQDPDDDSSKLTVTVNGVNATANPDGTFTATNVPLREGPNTITATATDPAGNAATAGISVGLDTTPPTITITVPSNGAMETTSSVNVIGNVNDAVSGVVNQGDVKVQVNGVDATVTNGTFSVNDLPLTPGVNTILAVAVDKAGNQSTAQIQVNVQPAVGQQHLVVLGGNNESAGIKSLIADPLLVELVDASGGAIANRAVTFTITRGDGVLNPDQQNQQTVTLNTDNNGQASVTYQLGTRVGVGDNQVTVTSDGAAGEAIFNETATVGAPVVVNVVSGDQQSGAVGQQLANPLVAIVVDVGGNPVPNVPITFTVTQGGGSLVAQGSSATATTSVVANSDANGKAAALLTLGAQEGTNNNIVTASFQGSQTSAATFNASGLQPGLDPSQTSVSGIVLDNANTPIEGVAVSLVGTGLSATTDSQGKFSIPGAPVGTVSLLVNGATANSQGKTYPVLNFQLTTVAGRDNTLGMPIYLPVIDVDSSQVVGGDNDVILQMKGVPGYQFKVFAHSATFPDGSHTGRMSLSQVHVDKVPMLPPNGTSPQIAGTMQPPGVVFNPPVQVQFPNTGGLAPGAVVTVYTYDHDLEQFISQGPAHVSADGSVIVSDPGFGITKSGWHFAPPPPPPHTCTVSCPSNDPCNTYEKVDCSCKATPAADGTACGTPLNDPTSCQLPDQCIDGICLGTDKPYGTPCDDNVYCTKDDKCVANVCEGTKIDDTSVQENYQYGGLNAVYSAVKDFLGKFGESEYLPDIEVVGQVTRTQHCCEEKQSTVANIQIAGGVSVGLQTPELPVPGLAGDLHLPLVGDIKAGLFAQFGGAIVAQIMNTTTPCDTPCSCSGGSLGLQLTGTLLLEAQIPNPALPTGCGLKGEDECNLAKVFLQAQTGLNFGAQVDCQSLTVGVDWPGVSFGGGVTLLEGTLLQEQLTFTYQPSWGQPQNITKATFTPVPWATGGSACQ